LKNFTQRAITGLSFAGIMIAAILWSPWSFMLVFFLILTFGLLEFYKLIQSENTHPQIIVGILISQLLFLILTWALWSGSGMQWMLVAVPLIAIVFIVELYRNKSNPFQNIAVTILGTVYLTLPILLMIKIAFDFISNDTVVYHGGIIMGCIFLLWGSDTGAYMIGSKFGKHRLFERISPKKSWEGFFGGLLTSLLVAWINFNWFPELNLMEWMIIGVIVVTTGTLGDLVESMLKRSIGVKDSGTIFPGHGGILDRFDGLLISMPFVFFYLLMLGKI
jgi:phosphatidate cytidylyltransferase